MDAGEEYRKEHLNKICVVNVKKTSGGHTSKWDELYQMATDDRDLINRQLSICNPDIIICCGTDGIYFDAIRQTELIWKCTSRGIWYVEEPDRLVVSYSHPEARVKDCLLYYGIVDAVKEIYKNKG